MAGEAGEAAVDVDGGIEVDGGHDRKEEVKAAGGVAAEGGGACR